VKPALKNMVDAAKLLRTQLASAKWTDQEMLEHNQPLSIGCSLWFLLPFFFFFFSPSLSVLDFGSLNSIL
jgi:hypothetical protein